MGRLQFVARSSTSIQQSQSWIITQRWCCAGPRLDRTRDVSPRTKIDTELQEQRVKDSEYTPLASLVVFCLFFCVRLFLHLLPFFFGAALVFFVILCTSGLFQFDDTTNTLHNSKGKQKEIRNSFLSCSHRLPDLARSPVIRPKWIARQVSIRWKGHEICFPNCT
jgi:hypothetical protein